MTQLKELHKRIVSVLESAGHTSTSSDSRGNVTTPGFQVFTDIGSFAVPGKVSVTVDYGCTREEQKDERALGKTRSANLRQYFAALTAAGESPEWIKGSGGGIRVFDA